VRRSRVVDATQSLPPGPAQIADPRATVRRQVRIFALVAQCWGITGRCKRSSAVSGAPSAA
jgi:hypothetical protein